MKKGVFPYFADGIQVTAGAENWDGVSGFVNLAAAGDFTIDPANYNGPGEPVVESGAAIYITNTTGSAINVVITGGVLADTTSATEAIAAGGSYTVMFHETHGFVTLGEV